MPPPLDLAGTPVRPPTPSKTKRCPKCKREYSSMRAKRDKNSNKVKYYCLYCDTELPPPESVQKKQDSTRKGK